MKRRRAWKWIAGLLGGIVVLPGLFFWAVHSSANRLFEATRRSVAAKVETLRKSDPARTAIAGDPIPGDAWPHYDQALQIIKPIPWHSKGVLSFDHFPYEDQKKILEMVPGFEPALGHLRDGLRSTRVSCPPEVDKSLGAAGSFPRTYDPLVYFLEAAAIQRQRSDRRAETLELALLLFEFPRDLLRYGNLHSLESVHWAEKSGMERARNILDQVELSAEELRRFARGLDRLGHPFEPVRRALELELALYQLELAQGDPNWWGAVFIPRPQRWDRFRQFDSRTLMRAEAIRSLERSFYRVLSIFEDAPASRRSSLKALNGEFNTDPNWIVRWTARAFVYGVEKHFVHDAEWTLMRTATATALYREETGKFPSSIAELVPTYLPSAPTCPLTGAPLCSKRGRVWIDNIEEPFPWNIRSH